MAAAVNHIIVSPRANDCATWAIATYLGHTYQKVADVVRREDRSKGKGGLFPRTMQRVCDRLGCKVRLVRTPNEDDYGILIVEDATDPAGHAVVQRNGLVLDVDGTVWERDLWLKEYRYVVVGLLMAVNP